MANYPNFYNTQQNNIIWVQGENSARSWIVNPNSNVILMDSDNPRFYIKSADNMGMPTIRTFEYTEITANTPLNTVPNKTDIDFIKRDELEALSIHRTPALEQF